MKNKQSFFSWQGNNLPFWPPIKWITLALIAIILILVFIFKKQIKRFLTKKGKRAIWKNTDNALAALGWFLLLFQVFKLVIYIAGDYPMYWENIQLHLCRIHMILICAILILKKKELFKYIVFFSAGGALIAIGFGKLEYPIEGNKLDLFKEHGIEKNNYSVGPDSLFFYDFYIFHIILVILPIILWTGFSWKISTIEFYRIILIYTFILILMWTLNSLSVYFPKEWRSNNWYIGPNNQNDYKNVFGILSKWPQNLFSSIVFSVLFIYIFQGMWIIQASNRKELFNEFIQGHKNIKKIFKKEH